MPSSSALACGGRSRSAAARFSRRWATDDVPGIRATAGDRWRSQDRATCCGDASSDAATLGCAIRRPDLGLHSDKLSVDGADGLVLVVFPAAEPGSRSAELLTILGSLSAPRRERPAHEPAHEQ